MLNLSGTNNKKELRKIQEKRQIELKSSKFMKLQVVSVRVFRLQKRTFCKIKFLHQNKKIKTTSKRD